MRSWSDKLHNATQALLSAVTDLHSTSQNGVMLRLVTSIADIAQLVEQLSADHRSLENELQRAKEASANILLRIAALERSYGEFGRVVSGFQGQEGEQESGEVSVNSGRRADGGAALDSISCQRVPTPESEPVKNGHAKTTRTMPTTPPRTPPPPSSPPQQPSVSPYKPLPRKQLPPLPTLQEVEAEQRQRRSQKRALASQKPPPCDKCKIRKRAMMLREHGYVKEDVFMRWSKRPGGCLQFMHYDEPVPEGAGSELSFQDTETQSPEE